MANSATLTGRMNENPDKKGKIEQRKVILDTINTDQLIHTPTFSTFSVYLKALFSSETSASNIKFKQRSPVLTGTVAQTNASPTITGTGTTFTTDFAIGDEIVITGGSTLTVLTVDSNTQITATGNATGSVSGAAYYKQQTLITPELAANQGFMDAVQVGKWILATAAGYSLYLSSSVAMSEILIHTQEGEA